jgi:hypothetical protein
MVRYFWCGRGVIWNLIKTCINGKGKKNYKKKKNTGGIYSCVIFVDK